MTSSLAKGKYYGYPVAAQIQGENGPITVTRYVVVTPDGDFLFNRQGEPRKFITLTGANSHAYKLNKGRK